MNETIETPYKGQPLRASWAAAVTARLNSPGVTGASRSLMRDGSGVGFEPLPVNLRARIRHRPFEVAGSGGEDYKFAIYVPDNVVAIGEDIVTPDGITAIPDTDGWYKIDDESEVSEDGSTLYLVAYDDGTAVFTFDLEDAAGGGSEDDPEILAVLPIAELKTQQVGQKTFGVVYRQLACHPFAVSLGGESGEEYIEAIVDLDFSLIDDPEDSYKKKLVVDITRKRIYGSKVEDVVDERKEVATGIEEVSVVEKSEYDVETHQFNNTKKKLMVLGKTADNNELVFQATPHSAEHPGGVV